MMRKDFPSPVSAVSTRVARGLAVFGVAVLGLTGAASAAALAAPAPAGHPPSAVTERGKIVGWHGGNAVIYPTAGFFGNPQVLAVGAIYPSGRFAVRLPARVPVDLLSKSSSQCATLRSSNPSALSTFTGDSLIFKRGVHIADTHSGSTPGIAAFTGFANGDTRSGFVYADRATRLTGFCQRTLSFGGRKVTFRQNFNLPLRKGWNRVAAFFSVPRPGRVVANLRLGSGHHEKWYLFVPPTMR